MQKLIVTRIGRRLVGFPSREVSSVIALPHIHPLPEPYPHLRGAAFVAGELVTVIDTFSLMEEDAGEDAQDLLLLLAPPHGHLALPIGAVETVLPYETLKLKEENAKGIWSGLYPWDEYWINVVHSSGIAEELAHATASAIHINYAGREHAL